MRPAIRMIAAAGIAASVLLADIVLAKDYPSRPVRVVAGNPGATADILARQIGRRLSERWGQQVVVDNRGGAAATIAAEVAANASADGYTLLMGQLNSHALAVNIYKRLSYDPVAGFAPITRVASAPQVFVVASSLPVRSWREFADYAMKRPGALNYASAGHGTASHLTMEFMKQASKLSLAHINYKGGASAMLAIMSDEAKAGFVPLSTALPISQTGKVRVLAIASMQRFPTLSDVPTLHESGLSNFEATSWFGLFAPAGTPITLIGRLNREVVEILRTPSVQQDLLKLGAETNSGSPEEFSNFVKSEIVKWRDVVKTAGIRPQ
jgi:tripartite-type tricarboxylate transporter receptor subunit TctC